MPLFSSLRRRANFRMMTPSLGRLVFGMMILVFTSGLVRAERVLLNWSEQIVGEPPAHLSTPDWQISLRYDPKAKIIDTKSDPVNPLPDSSLALVVPTRTSETACVKLELHPFLQRESPKKGWMELDLALAEDDMIVIALHANPSVSESRFGADSKKNGMPLYTLFFRGGKTTLVHPETGGGGGENFELSPPLMRDEPHKIRIAWDFEGEKPVITLLFDGEPFLAKDEAVVLGVDPAVRDHNIDPVDISVYKGYLGKITVSE